MNVFLLFLKEQPCNDLISGSVHPIFKIVSVINLLDIVDVDLAYYSLSRHDGIIYCKFCIYLQKTLYSFVGPKTQYV